MNRRPRRRGPSGRSVVLLVILGGALAPGAGGLGRPTPAARAAGDELRPAAELLHARFEQALAARAHALEARAREAAQLPELLSGLDIGADAHTFEDLLQTEDWWAPFRSEMTVSGLVSATDSIAMLGPSLGDVSKLELVRQARGAGTASGIVGVRDRAFALAAARVAPGKHRGAGSVTVVILGIELGHAAFAALADGAAAAVGLSDGTRVIESGGPDALRAGLTELMLKQAHGVMALDATRAGAAWPLDGGESGLSLLAVFPITAAAPPPPAVPGLGMAIAIALFGAGLVIGGVVLHLARRKPQAETAPVAAAGHTGAGRAPSGQFSLTPAPFEKGSGSYPRQVAAAGAVTAQLSGAMSAAIAAQRKPQTGSMATPIIMGRYHLLERVGEGGMAEIFIAATHGVEGFVRHFVVKRMHPHLARNREAVNQFVDEARLQSGLIHSNIVPVFDFGVAGEEYFMALEYIHGRDLERLVRRHVEVFGQPLSLSIAYYIVHDILEALAYAHSATGEDGASLQIVHRDVSPGNVLVSFRGEVKLSDFGIAKAHTRVSQTEVGTVKGNASFMSPEQARGEPVDARSDLFSSGVVLYYCLTGQFMYGDDPAVFKRLMRAAAGPGAPELVQMDKVPAAAAAVLRRALSLDPDQRYQDAREFARDVAGYFTTGRGELSDLMSHLFPDHRRDAR
jgi:hypothetical protein